MTHGGNNGNLDIDSGEDQNVCAAKTILWLGDYALRNKFPFAFQKITKDTFREFEL